jgi:prolyl-tRNA synthetase
MSNKGITPREQNYSQWYLDIIEKAELAENSVVRGSMVIKPYGYAIWEKIQRGLDQMIKESGAKNAYFPLFIPKSFLSKEASHVKGFAKECAIVTHHRLRETKDGKGVEVDPESKLEEELIVRPTSETIMYDTFSRWIKSWRDLPLKINQWANVVRWEKRTRPFLRTSEFLWQEGHTVHSNHEEAKKEVLDRLNMYVEFARQYLAMETYYGRKSESEKFAGAEDTYGVEAMMQDGKALQFGTSHDLGQNFSKVFNIQFADKEGNLQYPWQTSWGVSTRMMGALVMTHSDDMGLVLPPSVAPIKVVLVPIFKDSNKEKVLRYTKDVHKEISRDIEDVEIDERDFVSPGVKFNEWEKKGVPIRIEIGEREIKEGEVVVVRRDTLQKENLKFGKLEKEIPHILEDIQNSLYDKSKELLISKTYRIEEYEEFKKIFTEKNGFVRAAWCGSEKCEEDIKYETKITTRCLSEDGEGVKGKCIYCKKDAQNEWIFGKAY